MNQWAVGRHRLILYHNCSIQNIKSIDIEEQMCSTNSLDF